MEVPTFDNEDALYDWMDAQVGDSFQRAKSAVNDWWVRTVTALMGADEYYGWDTLDAVSSKGKTTPVRLTQWCKQNGLENESKLRRARQVARSYVASSLSLTELIDTVGPTGLAIVGSGHPSLITPKLEAALGGASTAELEALNRELVKQPEYIELKIQEAQQNYDKAKAEFDAFEGVRNRIPGNGYEQLLKAKNRAKAALDKARAAKTTVVEAAPDSPDLIITAANQEALEAKKEAEIAAIRKEREEYAKKAEQAVEAAKQIVQEEQRKAAALETKLKEAEAKLASSDNRIEKLKDAVAKYQDPKTVDASCLENRIQVVQGTAERWGELAVTYVNVLDQITDPWMKVRCEKAIQVAWEQWVYAMPIELLAKLEGIREQRLANAETSEERTLVTIDI
jgi:hypothetical protein